MFKRINKWYDTIPEPKRFMIGMGIIIIPILVIQWNNEIATGISCLWLIGLTLVRTL